MFKFRKLFSLEHDVVPKIPNNQLPHAGSENVVYRTTTLKSTPMDCNNSNNNNINSNSNMSHSIGGYSTTPPNSSFLQYHQRNQSGSGITIMNPMKINNNNNGFDQYKLGSSLNTKGLYQQQQYLDDDEKLNFNNNNNNNDNNNNNNNNISSINKVYQQINYTQSINLRIIGRDKNGTLIIARSSKLDGVLNTYIDLFDISKQTFTTILVYSGNVISAALSSDINKSFLVFTVKLQEKIIENHNTLELYSSFIYEINNKKAQTFIPLETKSHHPLMYHFLPGFHDKSSMSLLLFVYDECNIVKVQLKLDDTNQQIVNQNKKISKSNIYRKCFWYQYDYHNQVLYSLQLKVRSSTSNNNSNIGGGGGGGGGGNNNNNGTGGNSNYINSESILRAWSFSGSKQVKTIDDVPLHLNISDASKVSSNIPFPLNVSMYQETSTIPSQTSSNAVFQNIHIVKLPNIGLCLCHQEESSPHSLSIRISIYLLHLKQKIKYSIPLNTIDDGWLSLSKTRVLFDNFGSLLIVYVPGYFFQFIDCAHDHEPSFGITLYGKDLSIPLVEQTSQDSSDVLSIRSPPLPDRISTSVIPFYFLNGNISSSGGSSNEKGNSGSGIIGGGGGGGGNNNNSNNNNGNGKGENDKSNPKNNRYLFDYSNGVLYHYQFNREAIEKLFDVGMDQGSDVQAMHLAVIHLNDVELGRYLITQAAKNNLITIDLFKEYILACTYHALKSIQLENGIGNSNYLDSVYMNALPITCAESIENYQPTRKLKDLEISTITTQIPNSLLSKKEENRKRLKSFDISKSEILNKDGPSFSGFWRNFFGMDEDFGHDHSSNLSSSLNLNNYSSSGGSVINFNNNPLNGGGSGNASTNNNSNGNGSSNGKGVYTTASGKSLIINNSKYDIDPHLFDNYQEDPLKDLASYINSLTEFLYSISQKENKDRLNEWSNYFRHIQINVVNTLYKTIKICYGGSNNSNNNDTTTNNINNNLNDINNNINNNNNVTSKKSEISIRDMKHSVRLILFETMEKLYSAIEELFCPFPKDFFTQFTTLGFFCLQRSIFLQFLQKGIFIINAPFVKILKKEFPNQEQLSIDQRNFINQIILQLRDQDSVIEMLKSDLANTNIIAEHLISLATQSIHPKSSLDPNTDNPDHPDAQFIPLYCLLDFLKALSDTANPPKIGGIHSITQSGSTSSNQLLSGSQPIPMNNNNGNSKFLTPPTSPIRGNAQQQAYSPISSNILSNTYQPFSCSPMNSNFSHSMSQSLNLASLNQAGNSNNSNNNSGSGLNNSNHPIHVNRHHIQKAYTFLDQNFDRIQSQIFENINNCNKMDDSIN
ncbi:hypothetical protein ACTFIV_004593 [Dictyostelium citrinum]